MSQGTVGLAFPICNVGLISLEERIQWRGAIARHVLGRVAQTHALPAWKIEEQLSQVQAKIDDLIRGGAADPEAILREMNLLHNDPMNDYETEKRS